MIKYKIISAVVATSLLTTGVCYADNGVVIYDEPVSDFSSHWAKGDILDAISRGALGGYDDGTFRPDSEITVAEFLKAAMVYFAHVPIPFEDAPNIPWYKPYMDLAIEHHILDAGALKPRDVLTRKQMALIVERFKGAALSADTNGYKQAVYYMTFDGLMSGDENGDLLLDAPVTRAQAVAVLARTREPSRNFPDTYAKSIAEMDFRSTNMESVLGVVPYQFPLTVEYIKEADVKLQNLTVVDMSRELTSNMNKLLPRDLIDAYANTENFVVLTRFVATTEMKDGVNVADLGIISKDINIGKQISYSDDKNFNHFGPTNNPSKYEGYIASVLPIKEWTDTNGEFYKGLYVSDFTGKNKSHIIQLGVKE